MGPTHKLRRLVSTLLDVINRDDQILYLLTRLLSLLGVSELFSQLIDYEYICTIPNFILLWRSAYAFNSCYTAKDERCFFVIHSVILIAYSSTIIFILILLTYFISTSNPCIVSG